MASSASILKEINEVGRKIVNLRTEKTVVTNFKKSVGNVAGDLINAGGRISDAGNCWGNSFDQGKIAGYGGTFRNYQTMAEDIEQRIDVAIGELEDKIDGLRKAYDAALEAERAADAAAAAENAVRKPVSPAANTNVVYVNGYRVH